MTTYVELGLNQFCNIYKGIQKLWDVKLRSVFALTHLLKAQDWIWTSENYDRICLNKWKFFLHLAFGQVGKRN